MVQKILKASQTSKLTMKTHQLSVKFTEKSDSGQLRIQSLKILPLKHNKVILIEKIQLILLKNIVSYLRSKGIVSRENKTKPKESNK